MAVPHAVGAASLLWKKDIGKPASFIKGLLDASSKTVNDCNDKYSYIDLDYANEIYDDYYSSFMTNVNINKVNSKYENTESVEPYNTVNASWSRPNHERTVDAANRLAGGLTSSEVAIVKIGSRAPDDHLPAQVFPQYHMFHSMGVYNYVKVYEQAFNMCLRCKNVSHNSALNMGYPDGYAGDFGECEIVRTWLEKDDIKAMLKPYGYNYSQKKAALVMMGVAMHVVADAYAHKAYVKSGGKWIHIATAGKTPDTITDCPERWDCAQESCSNILACWSGNCYPNYQEFNISKSNNKFKLERFYTNCMNARNGSSYSNSEKEKIRSFSTAD